MQTKCWPYRPSYTSCHTNSSARPFVKTTNHNHNSADEFDFHWPLLALAMGRFGNSNSFFLSHLLNGRLARPFLPLRSTSFSSPVSVLMSTIWSTEAFPSWWENRWPLALRYANRSSALFYRLCLACCWPSYKAKNKNKIHHTHTCSLTLSGKWTVLATFSIYWSMKWFVVYFHFVIAATYRDIGSRETVQKNLLTTLAKRNKCILHLNLANCGFQGASVHRFEPLCRTTKAFAMGQKHSIRYK